MTDIPPDHSLVARTLDGRGVELHIDHGLISLITDIAPDPALPLVLPGLIDLQVNGYAGYDLNADDVDVDTVQSLTSTLAAAGTTTYVPTLITGSRERIDRALHVIAQARDEDERLRTAIPGVHLEGPYLSAEPGCCGAHPVELMRDPDLADLDRWEEAAGTGLVRMITIAPERPGSVEFIRAATQRGIICSIGHTHAEAADIRAAVEAGATMSTHLGNGSADLLPRLDNYIWAQLAEPTLTAGLIGDGHHLPSFTFAAMLAAKGDDHAVLVSDSAALAGAAPGSYRTPVGGEVTVGEDGRLSVTGTPYLAGSGACLLDCVRWAHRGAGLALDRAVELATRRPADLVGLSDRGALEIGRRADLLLVDDNLRVAEVYRAGGVLRDNP